MEENERQQQKYCDIEISCLQGGCLWGLPVFLVTSEVLPWCRRQNGSFLPGPLTDLLVGQGKLHVTAELPCGLSTETVKEEQRGKAASHQYGQGVHTGKQSGDPGTQPGRSNTE